MKNKQKCTIFILSIQNLQDKKELHCISIQQCNTWCYSHLLSCKSLATDMRMHRRETLLGMLELYPSVDDIAVDITHSSLIPPPNLHPVVL